MAILKQMTNISSTADISKSITTPSLNLNKQFNMILPANNYNNQYFEISQEKSGPILRITNNQTYSETAEWNIEEELTINKRFNVDKVFNIGNNGSWSDVSSNINYANTDEFNFNSGFYVGGQKTIPELEADIMVRRNGKFQPTKMIGHVMIGNGGATTIQREVIVNDNINELANIQLKDKFKSYTRTN